MKTFEVAVFRHRSKRGYRYHAYTRDYNPSWDGAILVKVNAVNGSEAKKEAIKIVKEKQLWDRGA